MPDSPDIKVALQSSEAWSRRISITVPAERVQRTRGSVAAQIARNARMPGFSKGRLPARVVEQRFGPSIEQETMDRLIQEAYREALDREGLTPISQGKVDNVQYDRGSDLVFEVELEVRPELELARTSGFNASRPPVDVGGDDVESVLERLREERAEWVEKPAEESPDYGDQVTVEITALEAEGEPQEEPRNYQFVLGEGQAIPDVESAILTLKPGQDGEFTVKFPDDFPEEERRGEEQRLHIELESVRRRDFPEIDDEFARTLGDFETVDALRERILTDLQQDAEQRADADVRRQLLEQVLEANDFTVPESMVQRYLDLMTGHSHEGPEPHQHTPEEEERLAKMREGLRPQAEASLKRMMVVDHLAEREGLRATQDEIDERVEKLAEQHERSPSEVWIELEKSGQLEQLERDITEDKVFAYLIEQNTVA